MKEPFVHHRTIKFGECDPGGIVYTPRITDFAIEANLAFLSHRLGGPVERRLFALGVAPPARALSLEFLRPMSWDDALEVHVRVEAMRSSAIVIAMEGRVAGHPTFRAELTMVCVCTERVAPVPIPRELREALASTAADQARTPMPS